MLNMPGYIVELIFKKISIMKLNTTTHNNSVNKITLPLQNTNIILIRIICFQSNNNLKLLILIILK